MSDNLKGMAEAAHEEYEMVMMESVVYLDGERLRRLRLERGLSQRELADKAGMSQSTIVLLERRGRSERFHPSTVRKLSGALGVDAAQLLED
jgi:transcriptional regulator with XRE-family HTH domain